MLHSGIDLHKRTIVLSTIDAAGTRVADAELPTSRAAVRAYFAAHPGPHRAVVESTATWYWLRDLLVPLGVDLKLGHSKYGSGLRPRCDSGICVQHADTLPVPFQTTETKKRRSPL